MYNSAKNSIIKLIPFIALYKYKLELIKKARNIKTIIKKARILIIKLQKLHTKLVTDIRFISEKIIIY